MIDLGRLPYEDARARQLELVAERQADRIDDTLIFVEHDHVITLGRAQKAKANVLDAGDVPVLEIERGGDVTYHGPGQLVAYPIVKLAEDERDLHKFLRALEGAVIEVLGAWGIAGVRKDGATGVWVGASKLCSIGIACRRWVTFHGLALNVATDLDYFRRINPCGFDSAVMASMTSIAGRAVTIDAVKPGLASALATALGRTLSAGAATGSARSGDHP